MNAIRRGAAAVLIAAALTATPATANADITRTQAELRQGTNPNHVLPSTEAEAWELYRGDVGDGGCWADYARRYQGLQRTAEKGRYMMIDSVVYPGWKHVWGPYAGDCDWNPPKASA
jgi:hypothetical protein